MKVKELIELLQDLPPEFEVVASKDGEGNNFSPVADLGTYMYEADSTWSGHLIDKEEIDGEEYKGNAVVLWPTN